MGLQLMAHIKNKILAKDITFTYQQTRDSFGYSQRLAPENAVRNRQPDLLAVALTKYPPPEMCTVKMKKWEIYYQVAKKVSTLTSKRKINSDINKCQLEFSM